MPPRTSPDSFSSAPDNGRLSGEARNKAKSDVKVQLRTLMTAVNARDREQARPQRDEKLLKDMGERINRQQSNVMGMLTQLLNPDGSLPQDLEKEISDEFSDPASREFINNMINGDANRLSTDATNLGRSIDGQPPISRAGNLVQRAEEQLSSIIDGFIENSQLPISPQMLQQAKPMLMNAIRSIFANIAERFSAFVPGAQEFAIRTRLETTWRPLLEFKMQNPNSLVAQRIRAFPGGPDALKEAYITAMVGQATERTLAAQAGQPTPTTQVTLESVLGLPAPSTGTPTSAPAPAPTPAPGAPEQAANRPLTDRAEPIQEMPMTFSNGEFRVQKGSDTFKAIPKHGTEAAVVTEVTPVRPATGQVENLTIKTRKGTEDITKTVRAADIKAKLEPSGDKRLVVDNVTYEFIRV